MREVKMFQCARWGVTNPDYLSFGVGDRTYCLSHIPWWIRLKLWWRERSHAI